MAKKKEIIKVKLRPNWEAKKGHAPHIGGAGVHLDRRLKRNRTRLSQNSKAINESC